MERTPEPISLQEAIEYFSNSHSVLKARNLQIRHQHESQETHDLHTSLHTYYTQRLQRFGVFGGFDKRNLTRA